MIGQRIEIERRFPWAMVVCLAAALILAGLTAVTGRSDWAMGAIAPFAIGLALLSLREPFFAARFTETAMEVEHPPILVPYASIQGVWASGRKGSLDQEVRRRYRIQLLYDGGELWIPARLNEPSEQVYRFLFSLMTPSGSRDVHPLLTDYLNRQVAIFGEDRVSSFRQLFHRKDGKVRWPKQIISLAVAITGIAWMSFGFSTNSDGPWGPAGIAATVLGVALFAVFTAERPTARVKSRDGSRAGLVVSPLGLALVQGDLKGELTWAELKDLKFGEKAQGFQLTSAAAYGAGIDLRIEGALIRIPDVYDRPILAIYECMKQYWR